MKTNETLRTIEFDPYLDGPKFTLSMWDTERYDSHGKTILAYEFTMNGEVVFEGEDFACSPLHAVDSDAALAGLMGFLTLRPGDTDPDYFAGYSPEQLAFAREHAEALQMECLGIFGDL
jgi:hypothetical protein